MTTHELVVGLLVNAIWQLLLLVGGVILLGVKKLSKSHSWYRILGAVFLILLAGWFAFQSSQAHQHRGFIYGALFAYDLLFAVFCFLIFIGMGLRTLSPLDNRPTEWAGLPTWYTEASSNNKASVILIGKSAQRLTADFNGGPDRWAQMVLKFDRIKDFSAYAGVGINIKTEKESSEVHLEFQVVMASGSAYISVNSLPLKNGRAVFLFQEMRWCNWSPENPNYYLDKHQINTIILGLRTPLEHVQLDVISFDLLPHSQLNS